MADPSWTVVITTRNRETMLKRALESCSRQTISCDVVVVDEASSDGTSEIAKSYPNVTYVRNDLAMGHAKAANIGIRASRTEWIKPLDDDDWLHARCLETMTNAIRRGRDAGFDPVLVSAGGFNVDLEERELGKTPIRAAELRLIRARDLMQLLMDDMACIGTPAQFAHDRAAALRTGGWNENRVFSHQHGDEVELTTKIGAEGDTIFIPDYLSYRTLWSGGSQDGIPHMDRFESNVVLKEQISEKLGLGLSQATKSYLALHWALVAIKDRNLGQVVPLVLEWSKAPSSVLKIMSRRRNAPFERMSILI